MSWTKQKLLGKFVGKNHQIHSGNYVIVSKEFCLCFCQELPQTVFKITQKQHLQSSEKSRNFKVFT